MGVVGRNDTHSTNSPEDTVISSLSPRARKASAVAAALAVTAVLGATAVAATDDHGKGGKQEVAAVRGSAEFMLPYYPDDDVRSFTFDAEAAPYSNPQPGIPTGLPTDAKGTVKISHYSAERKVTYTSEARVDCLVTGPHTATLTAVVTKVGPGGPPNVGKRLGFSVHDGGKDGGPGRSHDRVGFSWNGVNLDPKGKGQPEELPVGTCMAPAPYAPVTKGGYTVHHAELPQMPGQGKR
ncbi:hypothetical protein GCM10010218_41300 [Streptomyces mashuensis]|uniref:Repetin n=1 Tax=Streptomyces mashuensis TaxID=33904 RepID=A0A919EEP9_9ACTN|nr:hypothetical protein [Streptomyces mashuensis]GHF55511.1 hypothetical protein GCM10010218_41300 [Streptomyces mashuensis]